MRLVTLVNGSMYEAHSLDLSYVVKSMKDFCLAAVLGFPVFKEQGWDTEIVGALEEMMASYNPLNATTPV